MSADIAPVSPAATLAPVSPVEVNQALWNTLRVCLQRASAADDSRRTKDYADSALAIAQTIVQLDPNLIAPQGVPPQVMAAATPQQSPESHTSRGPGG